MFTWFDDFADRANRSLTIERADSRDRNTGGRSTGNRGSADRTGVGGGSAGRPGGVGNVGQTNRAPTTTDYGAPIHYGDQNNPITKGMVIAQNPQKWNATVDRVNTYNAAARNWNQSANQPSLGNLVNNIAPFGFSMQAPDYNKPKTYVGGDYHMGVNPMALAGSLLGGASMIPGAGTVAGYGLGKAYELAGGNNVMLGGGDVPKSWTAWGGGGQGNTVPGSQNMAQEHAMGGTQTAMGTPGGAPFGPQPTTTPSVPGASPGGTASGYFRPQLANHTVPQGYPSAFPNSLTEDDKRLLYAKALMGAA